MAVFRGELLDVRRDIERGLACYGRGAVLEALDAWRHALALSPANEEAQRLVELVERRLATGASQPLQRGRRGSGATGAAPDAVVENDLTPVSPISAWLAPSTHPTELELMVAGEEGAPVKTAHENTTRPVMADGPPPVRRPQSTASDRVQFQLDQCQRFLHQNDTKSAATAAELALQAAESSDDPQAWALVGPRLSLIERAFASALGPKSNVPFLARSIHGLDAPPMDHRVGFLLSCIDGQTDVATLLDICGMPRLEALRALTAFYHRGFLRMR
ncbi:MAG: hypothetical protein KA712_05570 [Myxococcales bacterium]|nr:hypothetical protein [Myxococcales bacterium]